ncbi:hypothetical protein MKFW12EY_26380 [Methylomonas koyamae]|nr:hypothetical protein MKFW12EY_26380 [Methylomonas koyamae]
MGAVKRWTIKNCNSWTSNTKATSVAFGADLPKPHVIPMGVDYMRFASGNREALIGQLTPEKLILLFVGRLVEKKGVADLLEAYALLPDTLLAKTELWIIGDGNQAGRLKTMATERRINHQVVFYGKQPNNRLPDYYAAADIFVAPSIIDKVGDTEGQGVIFLEALASGLPIIATDVGGIAEIIEHEKYGLLVKAHNARALAEAIEILIINDTLRITLGKNGKIFARAYDWKFIASELSLLYLSISNPSEFKS